MSSEDIVKMKELIHPKAILIPTFDSFGKSIYELREFKEENSVIWIKDVPDENIVFNLECYFPEPSWIFGGKKHECCRSDYVIITDDNCGKRIVFIEMKSVDDKDYVHMKNQLRGSQAFISYCQAVLDIFWKYNFPLGKYVKHFVVCTRTSEKYSQKYDRNESANTDVENPLKLEGSNKYQFNRLIGRKPR